MLTQEKLKKLIHYDPNTGLFTWLVTGGSRIKVPFKGTSNGRYLSVGIDHKNYLAHRLAWLYMTGEWPKCQIDHINGNKFDNRFINIRDVSRSGNQQNKIKPMRNNKSGFLGVRKSRNKYRAHIGINGNQFHIGTFDTAEEAYRAYIEKKREIHLTCTI